MSVGDKFTFYLPIILFINRIMYMGGITFIYWNGIKVWAYIAALNA